MSNVGLLIVQQECIERQMLSSIFEKDYDITETCGFDTAREIIASGKIDIVLIDVADKFRETVEFCNHIKDNPLTRRIILMAMLGQHGRDDTYELVDNGINYLFTKPIDPTLVKMTLSSVRNTFLDDRNAMQNKMDDGSKRFNGFLEAIPGGVIAVTKTDKYYIDYVSEKGEKLLKYGESEKYNIEHELFWYVAPEDAPKVRKALEEKALLGPTVMIKVNIRRGDETYRLYDASIKCVMLSGGNKHYDIVITPAREKLEKEEILKRELAKYQRKSLLDPLTQVLNKDAFYAETKKLLDNNKNIEFIIGVFNFDKFKTINELFGSKMGDRLICEFAEELNEWLKDVPATVGRLESDHFVACVPYTLLEENEHRLDSFLNGEKIWDTLDYSIYLHLGLYRLEANERDIAIACDRAYMALAQIKDSFVIRKKIFTSSLRDALVTEQNIMKDAKSAIENEEFYVLYQPIVDVQTREIVAAEALVRWRKPDGGFVSPGEFIPTFERNGFISNIDIYVWEKVCQFQHKRKQEGKRIVPVSVNLSRMDFYNPHLYEEISAITEKYELDSECLKVEITESAYMDQPKELMNIIQKFKDNGYKVLMDDFGSGYSSLNMLKDVSVDVLKIDMRFMDNLDTSDKAGNILFSIIQMAKAIQMEVIAEGVETVNQYEMLMSMDCDRIQGYYFYRPLPEAEFGERLDANKREMTLANVEGFNKILMLGSSEEGIEKLSEALNENCDIVSMDTAKDVVDYLRYQFSSVSVVVADFNTAKDETLELIRMLSDKSFYSDVPIVGLVTMENEEEATKYFGNGLRDILRVPYTKELLKKRIDNIIELAAIETEKRAVKVLRKNMLMRQQIASFFEDSRAGIIRLKLYKHDPTQYMEVVYANDSFTRILDITLDDLNGANAFTAMYKNLRCHSKSKFDYTLMKAVENEEPHVQMELELERGEDYIATVVVLCAIKYHAEDIIVDIMLTEVKANDSDNLQQVMCEAMYRKLDDNRMFIWRYSVMDDTNDYFKKNEEGLFERGFEKSGMESFIRRIGADEDSKDIILGIRDRILNGEEYISGCVDGYRDTENGRVRVPLRVTMIRINDWLCDEKHRNHSYAVILEDATARDLIAVNKWRAKQFASIFTSSGRRYFEMDLTANRSVETEGDLMLLSHKVTFADTYDVMLDKFLAALEIEEATYLRKKLDRMALLEAYKNGNTTVTFNFMHMPKNQLAYLWFAGEVIMNTNEDNGHVLCSIIVKNLDEENESLGEHVHQLTEKDSLTGLSNRSMLEKSMDMFLRRHRKDNGLSCFVIADIDNFQKVNDVFGHDVGDGVLRTISKTFTDMFNEGEMVSRLGGDEFGIFIPFVADKDAMLNKLESLCSEAVLSLNNYGDKIVVSCSIGCIFFDDMQSDFKHIYPLAARALQRAKVKGRKCFYVYGSEE